MLLGRVEVCSPSCFGLTFIVVLGVRGTKGDIRRVDGLRTVDHEEGGVAGGSASLRAQPPYYSGQFLDPFGAVLFDRVEYSGFEPLKEQAVGTFHLAVAPWVSYGGIIYVDAVVLAEVLEFGSGEGGAQVGNDPIRHSDPVCYFFDELSCLDRRCG